MLTRIEVKGFKNLLDVAIDFGPFTCIAGANGIGKSNIFDVIEFISYLTTDTLIGAAQRVRGSSGSRGGDPRDLFWDGYRDHPRTIDLSAEMVVPVQVEDELGTATHATTTFLRYDLTLGYDAAVDRDGDGRLVLLKEELKHIAKRDAPHHLKFPHSARNFRDQVISGERRGAYLSTSTHNEEALITVHGDGKNPRTAQPRVAARTARTVLSTVTTDDYPTILAARREMQSWRRIALEPSALRAPDSFSDPRTLGPDGRHLASTLYRIAHESDEDGEIDPDAVYARVAGRLSDLIGVRVSGLDVQRDLVREVFTLFLVERGGLQLPARALSEGTLRFLALCVLLEDPSFTGLICMEEPENGIHPANLAAMLSLVQDLAVDADHKPGRDNPFRQVIINTHSPGVVQLCRPEDLLLTELKTVKIDDHQKARALLTLPYRQSWRATPETPSFTEADIVAYLTGPAGARLKLPLGLAG